MMIDLSNKYTTAKGLGLALTPGANLIERIITGDELHTCTMMCNKEYKVKPPQIKSNPPLIKYLGIEENISKNPIAWSCIDILK